MARISLLELVRLHDFVRQTYPRASAALPTPSWEGRGAHELIDDHVGDDFLFEVLANVMRLARDAALPMVFAQATRLEHLGVLGFVMQTSSTVAEALGRVTRFQSLTSTSGETHLERKGDTVSLAWVRRRTDLTLGVRVANEVVLGQQVTLARQLGLSRPLRVRVRHRAPPEVAAHTQLFQAPIEWGSCVDAVDWPSAWLERPLLLADAGLARYFEKEAQRRLQHGAPAQPLIERVENAVIRHLASGTPSLRLIAKELSMSSRALQRGLASSGRTFRGQIDEIRRRRAEAALREGKVSKSELALLLGFSELSALSRASRRWFGPADKRASSNLQDLINGLTRGGV